MRICNKCFNASCKCKNKKTFECDELMIFIIKTLNQKGYKTSYCCAGHIENSDKPFIKTYILFNRIYNFNCKPKGFLLANESRPWTKGGRLRSFTHKLVELPLSNYEVQTKLILENNKSLAKWANSLYRL